MKFIEVNEIDPGDYSVKNDRLSYLRKDAVWLVHNMKIRISGDDDKDLTVTAILNKHGNMIFARESVEFIIKQLEDENG